MMNRRIVALAVGLVCLGAVAAEEGYAADATRNFITARLDSTRYNAGEIGSAVLAPSGDKTGITVLISGVPSYTSRPIHLYVHLFEGSCASKGSTPTYSLTDHVLANSVIHPRAIGAFRGPVRLAGNITVPFEKLRATQFAISISLSPADGNFEIFCGGIPS